MLDKDTAVILIDHGSVKDEANTMLEAMAHLYQETTGTAIVEAAHMELTSPTMAEALARCAALGAKTVVVMPYFLFPGRHSAEDIPKIAKEAAAAHPGIRVLVSEPLGMDTRLANVAHDRVLELLAQSD